MAAIRPFLLLILLIGLPTGVARAQEAADQPVMVDPPMTVRIHLVGPRGGSVIGEMVEYDGDGLSLMVKQERRDYRWIEITPHSAFTARYRLIDQKDPHDWLSLGEFAWAVGAGDEAEKALHWALRLDPSLEPEAQRIRAEAPGRLRGPFEKDEAESGEDTSTDTEATGAASEGPFGGPAEGAVDAVAYFEPVSPEQAAEAMEQADEAARRSLKKLGIVTRRLETEHFVVFTDWEPVDDEFLTTSLEQAYRLVAEEFGIPAGMNIFVGKLPVYMFDEHADFMRYAHEIDGQKRFSRTVAGYFTARSNGMGKMVMSKPKQTEQYGLEVARNIWRRNLTHEFSHAFFARYRSNAFVPKWLNEGLAEVIAEKVYPRYGALNTARMAARNGKSIAEIFNDRTLAGADMYPVMMTLVQALHDEDPRKFMQYVDRIKAGEDPEKLLEEMYEVDYRGLEAAWRRHMLQN